jgi:hypothetical protein
MLMQEGKFFFSFCAFAECIPFANFFLGHYCLVMQKDLVQSFFCCSYIGVVVVDLVLSCSYSSFRRYKLAN